VADSSSILEKESSDCVSSIESGSAKSKGSFSQLSLKKQLRDCQVLSLTAPASLVSGLSLTCAEAGRGGLKITGPSGLKSFWNSTANFTFRSHFEVTLHEQDPAPLPALAAVETLEFEKVLIHWLPVDSTGSLLCYAIETKVLPGKFDIARAKELGVPIGPLLGQLQSGRSVTLADGRTVAPEEVMAPSEKSRFSLIICNCSASVSSRGQDLLAALVRHPFWTRSVTHSQLARD
jgi:hypothetical protein